MYIYICSPSGILLGTVFCWQRTISSSLTPSSLGSAENKPVHDIVSLQSFNVGVIHPFIAPPHLQSLPYCNTIA